MKMTLAQALRHSKKLKGKIAELSERLKTTVSYETNNPPAFEFEATRTQLDAVRFELMVLQARIALTNATERVEGISITERVLKLQDLKGQIAFYKALPSRAHASMQEIKQGYVGGQIVQINVPLTCHFPEAVRAATVAALQEEFDHLNDLVEQANHSTPLAAG